ncbi:MAG: hypothetical protein ACM31O_18110 [Bacteroidota bacterium]
MVRLLARQRSRTLELVGLHALAAPDKSAAPGENLVRVMTTGRKAQRRSHLEGGLVRAAARREDAAARQQDLDSRARGIDEFTGAH